MFFGKMICVFVQKFAKNDKGGKSVENQGKN
jgi:hypothetical protein